MILSALGFPETYLAFHLSLVPVGLHTSFHCYSTFFRFLLCVCAIFSRKQPMDGSCLFTQCESCRLLIEEFSIFAIIGMFDHLSFKKLFLVKNFPASFVFSLLGSGDCLICFDLTC